MGDDLLGGSADLFRKLDVKGLHKVKADYINVIEFFKKAIVGVKHHKSVNPYIDGFMSKIHGLIGVVDDELAKR